jgi:ABC-type Mn2+/Zn2+ transport system permease subunit
LVTAAGVIAFVLHTRHSLILAMICPDIALTSSINVARLNLFFLLAFALTIALGLRYLGVLLMGSLLIIPAAIAKRLARNVRQMFVIAVTAAVASTVAGTYWAARLGRQSGPCIVMFAGGLFFLTLLRRRTA